VRHAGGAGVEGTFGGVDADGDVAVVVGEGLGVLRGADGRGGGEGGGGEVQEEENEEREGSSWVHGDVIR
jgi:hypothetical protein